MSGQNCRVWVDVKVKRKAEVDAKDLVREIETWGQSVMCAAGISYEGIVGPYIVDKGVKIDADVYIAMLKTQYQPDIEMMFPARDYVWQEDGAPAHTAKSTKEWVKNNMPKSLGKWPATSPDLNVMDYYCWSHVEQLVNQQAPTTRLELIVAIKKAFQQLELGTIRKAIDQFVPRLAKCVAEKGGHFEMKM